MKPEAGQIWQHFKGGQYRVLHVGFDTESLDEVVVYQHVKPTSNREWDNRIWVRPMVMWNEKPTVKPDSPCLHGADWQVSKDGERLCHACLEAAKKGRFFLVEQQDIYVIADTGSGHVVTRYFSSEENAEKACKILNEPLRTPCFRVEKRKLE